MENMVFVLSMRGNPLVEFSYAIYPQKRVLRVLWTCILQILSAVI